jgi:phenylpropionate dioxygenase-like ring-hydroxylating dioxygenase large terminal subunit
MSDFTPEAVLADLQRRVSEETRQADPAEHFVDVDRYVSQQRFDDEQRYVFQRYPIIVGHRGMLSQAGSCWTHDALGRPLLLCRDCDGALRAFYNVCRHRHTRLVEANGACQRTRLVCRYHGWAYDLDGRLLNVPLPEGFPSLDRGDWGLVPVPLEDCHGFLFVSLASEPPVSAQAHLAPIGAHLAAFRLEEHVYFTHSYTTVAANWKVIYDAFSEAYHVKRLHHATLADFFLDNMVLVQRMGRHMCSAVARSALGDAGVAADPEVPIPIKATFNYHIFPNSILIISPDYMNLLALYPQSPHQTLVLDTMLTPEVPQTDKARDHWQRSFELLDGGVFRSEDFRISEAVQAGLRARISERFVAGAHEQGIRLIHQVIDEVMEEEKRRSRR